MIEWACGKCTESAMDNEELTVYGLWPLVIACAAIFVLFDSRFTKPRTARDWLAVGAFSRILVPPFTERTLSGGSLRHVKA